MAYRSDRALHGLSGMPFSVDFACTDLGRFGAVPERWNGHTPLAKLDSTADLNRHRREQDCYT